MRIALVLPFVAFVVAACGASSAPSPARSAVARADTEECSRSDGERCVRDTQCCSLWCVNGACTRRDP